MSRANSSSIEHELVSLFTGSWYRRRLLKRVQLMSNHLKMTMKLIRMTRKSRPRPFSPFDYEGRMSSLTSLFRTKIRFWVCWVAMQREQRRLSKCDCIQFIVNNFTGLTYYESESIIIGSSDPVHLPYHCYQSPPLPSLSLTLEWPFAHMFFFFFCASESIFSLLQIRSFLSSIFQMRASLLSLVVLAAFASAAHKKKGHREVGVIHRKLSLGQSTDISHLQRELEDAKPLPIVIWHGMGTFPFFFFIFQHSQSLVSKIASNLQETAAAIHCQWERFRNIWRRRFVEDTNNGYDRKWRNRQWFQIPGVYVHSLRLGDNFVSVRTFRI